MTIGERIRHLRGEKTQADFAGLTKIPKNTLGRYERGEIVPGGEAIALLCKSLEIDPNWLLFGDGPMRRGESAAEAPQAAPAPTPQPEEDFKMSDMITKTVEVLESDTIYRTALASNINAFHQAVRSERLLAQLVERVAALEAREERWAQIEARMTELEKENAELRRRLERQDENTAKAVGADG
ncbi:MAG: helix-turn-helix domain-containing protein [Solidesulfovibrio sp. DCME]|uniref:helix-turn-helix domain-containing protein n=1 Tax=Solidesulfovibrio sp. DCME TaxID=3447380 RepID=UPI003D107EF6